jgi:hypothetical protein
MLLSGLFGGKYGGKNVKLSKIINDIIISGGLSLRHLPQRYYRFNMLLPTKEAA